MWLRSTDIKKSEDENEDEIFTMDDDEQIPSETDEKQFKVMMKEEEYDSDERRM